MYIDIIPLTKLPIHKPQIYTYEVGDFNKEIKIGQIVKVPLYYRQILGIVKNIKTEVPKTNIPALSASRKYKKIESIVSEFPLLNEQDLMLAEFISKYYYASLGLVLGHLVPDLPKVKIKKVQVVLGKMDLTLINSDARAITTYHSPKLIIDSLKHRQQKYLEIIKSNLEKGKQTLFLVPELSLIPQTRIWLKQNFKDEEVILLHSSLSKSDAIINWCQAQTNAAKIFLGTRRAVFTSFHNLGAIIMDEEQDLSYKQWDMSPRYDARTIAEEKARLYGCDLIFGTSAPQVTSYFKLINKTVVPTKAGTQKNIAEKNEIHKVQIVDMRNELRAGNYSIFSEYLQTTITDALQQSKQIILFVNRKGVSTFVMCRDCGHVVRCSRCNIALMEHAGKTLSCNHCNYKVESPLTCPQCKSHRIKGFGTGVEKVEQEIKSQFPTAKVSRLDTGVASRLPDLQKRYNEFISDKIDILVGTQIALRLQSPRLALIAAINIDSILNFPDWRTDEKAWHILNQITDRPSIIQTYNPDHKLLRYAIRGERAKFYEQELQNRKTLKYPPFVKMIKLICRSDDYDFLIRESLMVVKKIKLILPDQQVLGPICPVNERIRNFWYRHVIIKLKPEHKDDGLDEILKNLSGNWSIDVDPLT